MNHERILVMGVGNPLMRDEGAGPRTIEILLESYDFPDNVEVTDAGTMGLSILDMLMGIDRLVVVDAVKGTGLAPGTVVQMTPEDIAPNQVMHSLHDMRLSDVLQNAALIGSAPEAIVIGIQIDRIEEFVLELSPPVEEALPVAAAAVLQVLEELGAVATPKPESDTTARIIQAMRTYAPMPEEEITRAAEGSQE